MGNIIMILSLLQALDSPKQSPVVQETVAVVKPCKVQLGMSKAQLLKAWASSWHKGKRYYFEGEQCAFASHSCSVDVVDGRVSSFRDVKDEFIVD